MVFKFQRAQGMRDAFQRIRHAMGIVVHRIDAPRVARAVMGCVQNAIHDGVAHEHIAGGHIDFGTQDVRTFLEFTGPHAREQVEVFLDRAVAIRTLLARPRRVPRVARISSALKLST